MKRILLSITVIFLAAVALGGVYLYAFSRTPFCAADVSLHIPQDTSLKTILFRLEEAGVIKNAFLFRVYLTAQGIESRVRAGDYTFLQGVTPATVAAQLVQGDFKIYRFTIPEGWNVHDIANYLEIQGLSVANDFIAACFDKEYVSSLGLEQRSMEGYLFPSTYESYQPQNPQALIELMFNEFKLNYTDEIAKRATELNLSRHQVVTLASIIEKETGRAEERPLIAAVFHTRLKKRMRLQSDPTVIYGIENFDGNLTRRHLEAQNPYNTYTINGLPPGPIASPGKESLMAAVFPAEADYIYFVSKNDGSHVFSRTLEEHNRNVYEYQVKAFR